MQINDPNPIVIEEGQVRIMQITTQDFVFINI